MISLKRDHLWRKVPAFYNIYPIINEVHCSSLTTPPKEPSKSERLLVDPYYGRVFSPQLFRRCCVYGKTENMGFYVNFKKLNIVDELRVPYRRVPIFAANNLREINVAVNLIQEENTPFKILFRGQNRIYPLKRDLSEMERIYGKKDVIEPSFLPSALRSDFNEFFLYSMWHNQVAILLNDISYDYGVYLTTEKMDQYNAAVKELRHSYMFTPFSLGLAQHYGLPSLGLDLTDELNVAAWFALHSISVDGKGCATSKLASENVSPTIFVFRCPENSVYHYKKLRPTLFPIGRPDRQSAWFGHVGWGASSNQLASYLVCGFRIGSQISSELPTGFERKIFPSIAEDNILEYFVKISNQEKYEGEAKRALRYIYYFL